MKQVIFCMSVAISILACGTLNAQTNSYTTPSGTTVSQYPDRIVEKWTSPNGDVNTIDHYSNGGVTTTVEHPNGSKEINGVQVQAPQGRGPASQRGGNQGGNHSGQPHDNRGPNERGQGGRRDVIGGHEGKQ